jgi:CPA1 family monovalent cation:H+ antiporter
VVLQMHFQGAESLMQFLAVVIVLFARWFSVKISARTMAMFRAKPFAFADHMVAILTWGGLRGGLALAMALSLPASPTRDRIVAAVFGVVVFSVLVQGSTLPGLFKRWFAPSPTGMAASAATVGR